MNEYRIAVIGGDGVGPEVVAAGMGVLDTAASGFSLAWEHLPWGSDYYQAHGVMMPTDGLDVLKRFDAIYLGAVGRPDVPDHVTLWGLLLPIRQAFAEDEPVHWTRVHDLPDYVYFNHSAHVNAAVGCEACHGRIDQMIKVYQAKPLTMEWCLGCHRNPTPFLRNPENVTKMGYQPPQGEGEEVRKKNGVNPPTNCSTCHR